MESSSTSRRSERVRRALLPCLLTLLLILSAVGLHGFSLPYWHKLLDQSPADEVLFGEARKIRINDWAIHLPLALSQTAHEPRFPTRSDLIAFGGVNMRVGFPVAVKDWLTLFRPQVWGFFVGRDFGLAWSWWFRVLALFYAGFLAFLVLSQGRVGLALAAAVALTWAPFFQFWSFSYEPHVATALLCFVSLVRIARASSGRALIGWGTLLAWAASCFALGLFYPPHQITLAYLVALVSGVFLWRERATWSSNGRLGAKAAAVGVAVGIAILAFGAWFVRSSDAIRLVLGTVYPGARFDTGGQLDALRVVNNFFTLFWGEDSLRAFQNSSEASAFLYLSPLILAVVAYEWVVLRRKPDPVVLAVAGYQAFLAVYALLGFPDWLARLVFFGRVPAQRTILALGVADFVCLVSFLSSRVNTTGSARWARLTIPCVWAGGLAGVGFAVAQRLESARTVAILGIAILFLALGALVAMRHRVAAASLAVLSVACTSWFNPVVVGGTDYLERNPFCAEVRKLDRAAGGNTRWVVFNDPRLSNIFRAIGIRSVGGVHYYPQLELWERLGLLEVAADQWNRYANVQFALKKERDLVGLQLPFLDQVIVRIHPDNPVFARLDVDFVVFVGTDRHALDDARSLSWVTSIGQNHIFRVGAHSTR